MNIPVNQNAPVISKNQIEINAPIDRVWETLTDIKNWPQWQKAVSETTVKKAIPFDQDGLTCCETYSYYTLK